MRGMRDFDGEGDLLPGLEEKKALNYDDLLKGDDLEGVALTITEGAFGEVDFMKKDSLDRFLDFIFFKIQTGYIHIVSMAYPTKRMMDKEMERKIIDLINNHLYPEIIFRILKFFSRNIRDPDTNLYIAYLIESDDIIRSIFETYKLFKKDVFIADPYKRTLNVKRIQQFSPMSDNKLSSPLESAAIFKFILEFIALKKNVEHIYKKEDLPLVKIE